MPSSDRQDDQGPAIRSRPDRETGGCGHDCASCSSDLRALPPCDASGPFVGWSLAAVASLYFLLPIALALTAASFIRAGTDQQTLAALGGLLVGMVLTASGARSWTRRRGIEESRHG